jgi:hypothetical protein
VIRRVTWCIRHQGYQGKYNSQIGSSLYALKFGDNFSDALNGRKKLGEWVPVHRTLNFDDFNTVLLWLDQFAP